MLGFHMIIRNIPEVRIHDRFPECSGKIRMESCGIHNDLGIFRSVQKNPEWGNQNIDRGSLPTYTHLYAGINHTAVEMRPSTSQVTVIKGEHGGQIRHLL